MKTNPLKVGDELLEDCGCVWVVVGRGKNAYQFRHKFDKFDKEVIDWDKNQVHLLLKTGRLRIIDPNVPMLPTILTSMGEVAAAIRPIGYFLTDIQVGTKSYFYSMRPSQPNIPNPSRQTLVQVLVFTLGSFQWVNVPVNELHKEKRLPFFKKILG